MQSVHEGLRLFKCDSCDKDYTTRQGLKHHVKVIQTLSVLYTQDIIWKVIIKEQIFIHLIFPPFQVVHLGYKAENLYKCQACEKAYTQKHNLTLHTKNVHGGVKVFQQSAPGQETIPARASTQQPSSSWPSPQIKSKRLYHCAYCDKAYTQKHNLNHHTKNVHPNRAPDHHRDSPIKMTNSPPAAAAATSGHLQLTIPGSPASPAQRGGGEIPSYLPNHGTPTFVPRTEIPNYYMKQESTYSDHH